MNPHPKVVWEKPTAERTERVVILDDKTKEIYARVECLFSANAEMRRELTRERR